MSNPIEQEYPLHYYIWTNDFKKLKNLLNNPHVAQKSIEKRDIRGRTPLMLAVSLGHFECAKLLMNSNANVNIDDDHGFNVLHEAIATNDPELVQLILEKRDSQRISTRLKAIPTLLRKIRDSPDFYVEMKWEFTSWVPLLSKICPNDVYKIYKSGSSVRVDTTLSGFEQMSWQRGARTYIFTASEDCAKFFDINHDNRQVHIDKMVLSDLTNDASSFFASTSDVMAQARLTCPTSITYLDTDNIVFERSKSGIIGFRTDRTEVVNGYECKVFTANNVQLITKTRTEHLSDQDKQNYKEQIQTIPFQSLLNTVEVVEKNYTDEEMNENQSNNYNLSKITLDQYFDPNYAIKGHDIGRPREMTKRINKFKTHLWLSEEFPLSLQEQILPIIDLMAISSSHFSKLKDFITLQLPSGFPVQIQIPLFHIVNARVSFQNIFALDESVDKVTTIRDDTSCACVIDEAVFQIPSNYSYLGNDDPYESRNGDEYVDLALQRYISNDRLHKTTVNNGHAYSAEQPDPEMQRAIEESLKSYNLANNSSINKDQIIFDANKSNQSPMSEDLESDLERALTLSQLQIFEDEKKRQKADELELEEVLKISLIEK